MRKILFAALALIAFDGVVLAQNLPSYVPANGLVGWWPFNGNANDESGNNYHATNYGATISNDRFGNSNSAFSFNGTSSFMTTPLISEINNLSAATFSLWVKVNGNNIWCDNPLGDNMVIISREGDFDSNHFQINASSCGNPRFEAGSRFGAPSGGTGLKSLVNYPRPTSWHHVIWSIGGGFHRLYIDGNLDTTAFFNGSIPFSTAVLNFGKLPVSGWEYFLNGSLDDIAIYNRALSQQEITALYQGGNASSSTCLDLPTNLQQGLVGYWPFCGNSNDESGNGNNGTVNGATLTTDRFGNQASAYQFDGVDDFTNVPYNPSFNMQKSTWSFWTNKLTSAPANGNYILGYSDNEGHHISNITVGDSSYCQIVGSTWPGIQNGAGYIPNNSWHMISFTYDQTISQSNFSYYLDGVKLKTVTLLLPINFSTNSQLRFGVAANGLLFNPFNGSLDDIAIWNRVLSQSEITQLYNQGICQQSITVTDTLLIHTGITSYNPIAYENTLKVWPNPGNQDITIDAGNLALMQGWKIKISNSLGQEVYPATLISQQQQTLDLTTWGGNGLYLLHLINPQGHITEVKKIVLAQ